MGYDVKYGINYLIKKSWLFKAVPLKLRYIISRNYDTIMKFGMEMEFAGRSFIWTF